MGLVAVAAAAPAAAVVADQGRERAGIPGRFGASASAESEHRDGAAGRLFAVDAIGALRAHRLQLLEFVAAGRAKILIKRHSGISP